MRSVRFVFSFKKSLSSLHIASDTSADAISTRLYQTAGHKERVRPVLVKRAIYRKHLPY